MFVPELAETNLRRIVQAVRTLATGGTNATGGFALAVGETETVVPDRACAATSLPVLMPWSAAAVTARCHIKSVARGQFVLGHDPAPDGAAFRYELRQP